MPISAAGRSGCSRCSKRGRYGDLPHGAVTSLKQKAAGRIHRVSRPAAFFFFLRRLKAAEPPSYSASPALHRVCRAGISARRLKSGILPIIRKTAHPPRAKYPPHRKKRALRGAAPCGLWKTSACPPAGRNFQCASKASFWIWTAFHRRPRDPHHRLFKGLSAFLPLVPFARIAEEPARAPVPARTLHRLPALCAPAPGAISPGPKRLAARHHRGPQPVPAAMPARRPAPFRAAHRRLYADAAALARRIAKDLPFFRAPAAA